MVQKKKHGREQGILERVFWALSSLKMAVLVILSLAIALATATVLESLYDTPTGQYWVYKSGWFAGILILLGINILFVALSRWPWKKRHIPFLLAHAGILILLIGSWITERWGIDGNLRITESETTNIVELDQHHLIIKDQDRFQSIAIPWIPPEVTFKPLWLGSYGLPYDLKIERYLSHADSNLSFVPAAEANKKPIPALHVKLAGGPMGISQDLWLWEGAPSTQAFQAGPAFFALGQKHDQVPQGHPAIFFDLNAQGGLSYWAQTSDGKRSQAQFPKGKMAGKVIHPGWRGDVTVTVVEAISDAMPNTLYKSARVQHGVQAPPPAIYVTSPGAEGVWLGLGDRALLHLNQREVEISYLPRRIVLPFSVRLERFTVEHDQGTWNPAAYSSRVTVMDPGRSGLKDAIISMNEPLQFQGFTLYQASYEDADPRPVTSIFSVNRDPGRVWKYLGSLLIVLGSILLFAAKYRQTKSAQKKSEAVPSFGPAPEGSV